MALAALWAGGATAALPSQAIPPENAAATASETEVQAAQERWRLDFEAAMIDHARALAARGDARSLLAAAMIVPPRYEPASGRAMPGAVDPQPWFDAARAVRPADPLVTWLEAMGCAVTTLDCDSDAALVRLLQADGDNAAVHWLAVNAAVNGGDELAARTHLRLAAQADRFDIYNSELLGMLLDARNAAPLATMDAANARLMGISLDLDRPATNVDMVAMVSIAQWSATAVPPMLGVMQLCGYGPDRPEPDAALRQDCGTLMARLAIEDSIMVFPAWALPVLIQSTSGAEQASWQARLRELAWLYEHAATLMQSGGMSSLDEYVRWIVDDGELGAMRTLLQRNRIQPDPPAGWLPDNPRYRALITAGVAPSG